VLSANEGVVGDVLAVDLDLHLLDVGLIHLHTDRNDSLNERAGKWIDLKELGIRDIQRYVDRYRVVRVSRLSRRDDDRVAALLVRGAEVQRQRSSDLAIDVGSEVVLNRG